MFLEITDIIHLIFHQHQQTKKNYEAYLLVCLAIFCRGVVSLYLHRSKIAVREETYLNRCVHSCLLPFIKMTKFYFSLTLHHSTVLLQCCTVWNQITFLLFVDIKILPMSSDGENLCFNRTNAVSARIGSEKFGPTVKSKIKQSDQVMVTNMIQGVRGKLLKMYRKGVYSVC